MHSTIFTIVTLLFTLVTAIDIRNGYKTDIDSQCFICPPVKSFRFGIRPWLRYEPSDIKFQQHEHSFSCVYKAAVYTLTDKHDSLTEIGRCNYYNDGVLRRENKDKDNASSLECPSVAPSYKGCGYRVHAARAVEERQEPGEQSLQENIPASPPSTASPGDVAMDENEADENENEEPEGASGEEEEEDTEEDEDDEDEGDEEEDEEGDDEEDENEDEEDEDEDD